MRLKPQSNQTITIGLPDNVTVGNNLTVTGNLTVNGSTTQVNTSQTTIEDQLLELGMVDGSAPSSDLNKDIGVIFNFYTSSVERHYTGMTQLQESLFHLMCPNLQVF